MQAARVIPIDQAKAAQGKPTDPPPPHDLHAERALLRDCILFEDAKYAIVAQRQQAALGVALEMLRPEHFFDLANGRIFQVLQEVARDKIRPDITVVRSRLADLGWLEKIGGEAYLTQIEMAPSVATNAKAHALIVERKWRLREALALLETARVQIRHGHMTEDEDGWLRSLPDQLSRIVRGGPASTCITLREALEQSFADIERAAAGGGAGYPTGIRTLDGLTGGVQPAEVVLVKAPKKSGKSVLVGQIACSVAERPRKVADGAWRWRGALIFALEGKSRDWSTRMACSRAQLDYDALLKGRWGEQDFAAFTKAASDIVHLQVRIEAEKKLTLDRVAARVRAVREEMLATACLNCGGRGTCGEADQRVRCAACEGTGKGIDLAFVAIDYAQLLRDLTGSFRGNREQFLSSFVSDLMDLASAPDLSGIAWMVNSQMNKDGVARESEAIEMHVDRVWRLSVERERDGRDGHRASMNVEYSRRGPMGPEVNAAFWFEPAHTVFYG